ncbi:MAG: hypothetical protein ACQESK_02845 [Bacteroidota bacterium]
MHTLFNLKNILIFLLFGMISATAFSQPTGLPQTLQETDTTFQKKWFSKQMIITNQQGDTIEIAKIKNDLKHGKQKKFYPNGDINQITTYKKGNIHGKKEHYHMNGGLYLVQHYKYNSDEEKSVLDGKQKVYRSGELAEMITYKNGIKNGSYEVYHHTNNLKEKGTYEDGVNTGNKKTYDPKGNLLRDENFVVDTNSQGNKVALLNGRNRYYYNNGEISQDCEYKKGEKHGTCKEYFKNKENSLKSEVEFNENLRHGSYIHYFENGNPERKGIYYQEIKTEDTLIKNVYEGRISTFYKNGNPKRIERWENYKKNGAFETFYENGQIATATNYSQNLKHGAEKRWDKNGNLTFEAFFEIDTSQNQLVSKQIGVQKTWQNGRLTSTTNFENGKRNGKHESFFSNGETEKIMHFKADILHGKYQLFYENGQIQNDYNYRSNGKNYSFYKWNYTYDKSGNLTRRFYYDKEGKKIIEESFDNNIKKEINVDGVMKLLFVEGNLSAILWMNNTSHPFFGYRFFSNHQLRKVHFLAADNYQLQEASLTPNGKVFQVITNGRFEDDKQNQLRKTAGKLGEKAHSKWNETDLVKSENINGNHQWKFNDNSLFFDISFKDNLPDGKWLVKDPISKDTLIHYEFKQGKPVGKWVKKKHNGILLRKTEYNNQHQVVKSYNYNETGDLIKMTESDSLGKTLVVNEYFDNGQPKQQQDYRRGTFVHFKENGDTLSSHSLYIKNDSIKIRKTYYPDKNQLKNYRKNNLSTQKGEAKTFAENGQLLSFHELKDNETHGKFNKYNKNGNLLLKGEFDTRKRTGKWTYYTENGEVEKIEHYKDGELIIDPETAENCACYDKSLPSDKVGFAQNLASIADYNEVKRYFPDNIKPLNEFNYDHIYFINFQGNSSSSGAYFGMKLLLYREFSFYVNNTIKIELNPCRTSGYISNIDASLNYNHNGEKLNSASLQTEKIAISLVQNPLQSQGKSFTGIFNTQSVVFTENTLEIHYKKDQESCFKPAQIDDFFEVEVQKATARVQANQYWQARTNRFPLLQNEARNFTGFHITESLVHFKWNQLELTSTENEIYAGSNFVAAEIKLNGTMKSDTEFIPEKSQKSFQLKDLERFLEQQSFYRILLEFDDDNDQLILQFYVEK